MNDDADTAARVIERLLVDPAFRADFRRDPATACSDAGLDELADYMAQGRGGAMHTLEVRESRSSLAGVMMAAALEGVGVLEFARHIVPGAIAAPGAARDVLSRVNLPAIDGALGMRGALAQAPGAPAAGAAPADAIEPGPGAPAAAQAPAAAAQAEPEPEPAREPEPKQEPDPRPEEPAATPAADAEPVAAQASGAPVDPAQFGAEGTGGDPSPEMLALLENKNVVLDKDGVADIKAGIIDPRVVAVLTKLSEDHKITVSCMCSDHPTFTTAGSVSNHHHGRGVDIAAVDGIPVNAANPIAREIATELSSLDASYRPNEIGTPWAISGAGYFTDADHNDHLHVAFKQPIDPSWKPPRDQAVASTAAAPAATVARSGTLAIAVPEEAGAAQAGTGTLGVKVPEAAGASAPAAGADAPAARPRASAGADAAAENLAPGGGGKQAGAKALAALEEAMKYKGTPYLWGGSNPKTGFDCSGLTQWAYAQQGIETGRTTYDQIDHPGGTKVDRKDLVPGDLVFFKSSTGDVHHMGMSMGGDKFLHAPHTGDVVKISSLEEPYYAQQFAGGRRFDETPAGAPDATPRPEAVKAAGAALARDAAAVKDPSSMIFKALTKQEASHRNSTVQFMRAVKQPEEVPAPQAARAAVSQGGGDLPVGGSLEYPGDNASKAQSAAWLAAHAQKAGLPPELPVMASLVESGLRNLSGGHADSVGFFQMRVGIWNKGEYAGYPDKPELQAKWFVDHALAHKKARIAAGDADFGKDPSTWGTWIADVERPAEQYRGRYQLRLQEARDLLGRKA